MLIRKGQLIAGLPAFQARALMRRMGDDGLSPREIAATLKLVESDARVVIERLEQTGHIERDNSPDDSIDDEIWLATSKGRRLSLATGARPLKRATAERVLRGLLDRVAVMNESDRYAFVVTEVYVFGSYLTDAERLGDVDVAIALAARYTNEQRQNECERESIRRARENGRLFRTQMDELRWPAKEALLFLKSRSRALSLHCSSDGVLQKTASKVIYTMPSDGDCIA